MFAFVNNKKEYSLHAMKRDDGFNRVLLRGDEDDGNPNTKSAYAN
jgi:hypothetical protein